MAEKKLPYNCPLLAEWFEDFQNIRNCFTRLGGLPYEILKHSGLSNLEIFGFFDDVDWEDTDRLKTMQSGNRIIALEIYMQSEKGKEPQKAYLFSDSTNGYYSVYKDGLVDRGRLILTKEKLKKWEKKGYSCIVPADTGRAEIYRSVYAEIFGSSLFVRNIKPWSNRLKTSSNGYKEVYLILNYAGDTEGTDMPDTAMEMSDYVIEVDYYAINSCFRLLGKERYIRQNMDPFFLINRINPYDSEVGRYLMAEHENVFLAEMGYELTDFPNCYQRLAYYTAYIAYHYPDLVERMNRPLPETECVAIGASMEIGLYAAYCLSDGSVHLMKNPKLYTGVTAMSCDCEIEDAYTFDLNYDLFNAGVGISELGLSFQNMLNTSIYPDVTCMGISMPMRVPQKEEIQRYMQNREKSISMVPKRKSEVMLYYELELEEADGEDIIKGAAQMAGMEQVEAYNRAMAIYAGYVALNPDYALENYENAIVFDWRNDFVEVTLLRKENYGVRICEKDCDDNPLERTEDIMEEMTVYDILFRNMRAKMLEQEDFLKLMKLDESNEEAWQALYDSCDTVMKQFMRENNGVLILKNAWAYVEEELSYARFKEIFKPYFEETTEVIERVLRNAYFEKEYINKVYVSGYWGNYPYVWDCLEEFFGKDKIHIMADTGMAATLGAAYLAGKQKDK